MAFAHQFAADRFDEIHARRDEILAEERVNTILPSTFPTDDIDGSEEAALQRVAISTASTECDDADEEWFLAAIRYGYYPGYFPG